MIAGPKEVFTADERLKGYRRAMEQAGVEISEELIVHSDYTIAGGAEVVAKASKIEP